MLKCLAIDDEPLALRQLTAYIGKIPYLELAGSCNNALEAQQFLTTHPVELIFVDINMPDLNGVDFVRSLVQRPMVIFTTAYSEYAVEGFKLDAVDYLLKPFSFADFSRSAAKANSLYELRQNQHRPASDEAEPPAEAAAKDKEYLSVKADYKVSLVKISDIVYLESEGEYVRMHLADHTAITTLFRLKNMETALPADTFMRVHRSYIVNLKCTSRVASTSATRSMSRSAKTTARRSSATSTECSKISNRRSGRSVRGRPAVGPMRSALRIRAPRPGRRRRRSRRRPRSARLPRHIPLRRSSGGTEAPARTTAYNTGKAVIGRYAPSANS